MVIAADFTGGLQVPNLHNLRFHSVVVRAPKEVGEIPTEVTLFKQHIRKFLADEAGATAIEYGLIAAGISLAIIAAVNGLGTTLNTQFTNINGSLK
jgi:pilus assembly protein Flp/PilA